MRSLVIVPSYNEAQNVLPLSADVLSRDPGFEILVVDDASPDGTADLVARAAESEPRLHLLRRPAKLGLGSAYLAGFRRGLDGEYARILTMDCDYSHHPRYLPGILAAMSGADLVIGSRYTAGGGVANWPLRRRLLSRFANAYTRVLLGLPVRDCTAGFRMVWRVHRCGFRIAEIPIAFEDRTRGDSKIDHSEIYRAAWHVLQTAIRRPSIEQKRRPPRT
jgi:dolichol-phosphate mannosyltransferase